MRAPSDSSLLMLEGRHHGNKVTGKWQPHWFNFHCIFVDRKKGPASDSLVQRDGIFIRFNFSRPDTHMLFNFLISPLSLLLLLVLRTKFSETSFRGVQRLRGGPWVDCVLAACMGTYQPCPESPCDC